LTEPLIKSPSAFPYPWISEKCAPSGRPHFWGHRHQREGVGGAASRYGKKV